MMYLNVKPWTNGTNTAIKYKWTEIFSNLHVDKLYQGLDSRLCIYNHAGQNITEIRRDQQFESIMDTIKDDLGVNMNYTDDG